MALGIRSKLFLGMGSTICVAVLSGLLIVQRAQSMNRQLESTLRETVEAKIEVTALRGLLHEAVSMHRAYMILGLPELADARLAAWTRIDRSMHELDSLSSGWESADRENLDRLVGVLGRFRQAQDQIADVAHTRADRPADAMFFDEGIPLSLEVTDALDEILMLERGLDATPERKLLVERVAEAKGHLLRVTSAISAYLASGSEDERAMIESYVDACSASVARLHEDANLFDGKQRQAFDRYLSRRDAYLALANRAIEIRESPGWCVSEDICLNRVAPLAEEADGLADRLMTSLYNESETDESALHAAATSLPYIVICSVGLSALLGIGLAVWLVRSIGSSISAVAERASSIAGRDLTSEPLDVRTTDELGRLATGVNEMQSSLRSIIGEVSLSASEVAAASEQISRSAADVSRGMEDQMVGVERISAAVDEMSASVRGVAESASSASAAAEDSARMADEGGGVVRGVVERMGAIRDSVEAGARSVSELGRRSESIGALILVINEIADQTNLLALNAAIEAARAGEHGRGFAVVADEVRKLAERTQQATEEVRQSISAIQTETAGAVSMMDSGTGLVREGFELAGQAGSSLEGIVSGAGVVTGQIRTIAAASQQQATAADEISRSLTEIASVVKAANVSTTESASSADHLASKAESLREIVGRFRL